jgi:branched-chain amino acid transport system permease protein
MFIYPILVMKVLCFALFACAFNLLLGYTGLLSFGHAVFLGSAAYVTGHALKVWQLPTLLGLLAGTGAATLLGWAIGSLAIRRQGIYFAMVTLALAQMVFFFFLQAPFTGGEDGCRACRAAPCSALTWPTTSSSTTWCWRSLPAPSG